MAIGLKLLLDDTQILDRVVSTGIDQVNQKSGAFNVAEKVVPQSSTLGCTGNQPRDVGKDGAVTTGTAHHTQVGNQRGEGIISNLGASS